MDMQNSVPRIFSLGPHPKTINMPLLYRLLNRNAMRHLFTATATHKNSITNSSKTKEPPKGNDKNKLRPSSVDDIAHDAHTSSIDHDTASASPVLETVDIKESSQPEDSENVAVVRILSENIELDSDIMIDMEADLEEFIQTESSKNTTAVQILPEMIKTKNEIMENAPVDTSSSYNTTHITLAAEQPIEKQAIATSFGEASTTTSVVQSPQTTLNEANVQSIAESAAIDHADKSHIRKVSSR
jgi:hypothetical protein